jgi:ubiquinone/menaquinone biosynthesis C-methylase UbiE
MVGAYSQAAEFYDLLYSAGKDYGREAELVSDLIRARAPEARTILDAGCGTGAHARALIDIGFDVDGIDIEPAFVEIASRKCPEGTFAVADMRTMELEGRYDAVMCLFSAIGYVKSVESLERAIRRMTRHLKPGGVLLVDPWFAPGEMDDGHVMVLHAEDAGRSVVRMSRTVIEGAVSRLEFEYLIGDARGLERRSEVHELGLFTGSEVERAFQRAGHSVERIERTLRTRGIYVGTLAAYAGSGTA